jgi:hypothetical protein
MDFLHDPRFAGILPFDSKVWLSSPTMHGDEERFVVEAIRTNWVSTVGENINKVEEECAAKIGRKYGVALSSGTAAPAAPANLKATAQSSTAVRLTWNRVATASTYHLQRAVKHSDSANPGNAEYQTIASGITAPNYTDTNLQPSTRYCYKVAAANAGREGSFSDAVEVTTAD